MEWLDRMNEALEYIEDNIEGNIDYDEIAKKAYCSTYHFQRMFSFIIGIPLSEYIRRRKLTLAAFELQNSDIKIIDLGMKYGYESPDAFRRAFQRHHGVTPTEARKLGVQLKSYSRISFHISIRGDECMNFKIEKKDAFSVFGLEKTVSLVDGECYKQIPEFWMELDKNGGLERISKAAKGNEVMFNAAKYGHEKDGTFKYMVCKSTPEGGVDDKFVKLDVPECTWVVFPIGPYTGEEGTKMIHATWKRIYPEWFPTSGYEHSGGPEFEMYYSLGEDKFITEIWIPVIKNK
ncbi:AraC family transcriptional regulator [Oceanirhabdus sp. W0125-5]|uniref:AraC family transcriptional regulator n=1 Tax=Oceanirhabdus sp. W0125-5 TaxID=2999116 RepID=UPI0022F2F9DA|nr:AraC family transcriptional regulator [Oceanirhabdus sp. W0125-5]WBW96798.1 AraC family transcriptional regulator [Oceanirhabdus sp. W0125-5]